MSQAHEHGAETNDPTMREVGEKKECPVGSASMKRTIGPSARAEKSPGPSWS